jgi:hypothetical protein
MEHFKVTNQVEHTSGLSCSKNTIVAASAPEILPFQSLLILPITVFMSVSL